MEWFVDILKQYGPFVALVAYVLWDARNRELRYVSIIDKQSGILDKLSKSFQGLQRDVEEIKKHIERE